MVMGHPFLGVSGIEGDEELMGRIDPDRAEEDRPEDIAAKEFDHRPAKTAPRDGDADPERPVERMLKIEELHVILSKPAGAAIALSAFNPID
jgi:hypothetical protein